jgi:hypothetical protein
MNSIRMLTTSVCRYGVQHFSYDQIENSQQYIFQDLTDSNMSIDSIKPCTILLDFRSEGQCDQLISPLIHSINYLFNKKPVVIFNSVVKNNLLDYEYFCMPAWMTAHCEWFESFRFRTLDYSVKHKFLSLMRRPSLSRAKLASKLIDGVAGLKISFGSMYRSNQLREWKDLFLTTELPLTIDGLVDEAKQHDSAQDIFSTCLFNIVAETSSQHDQWSWRGVFITEKTFKAFGLKQIPLWWAVPGLVAEVRNLGFDMFDDLVDHTYDQIANEDERLTALVDQIKLLDKKYSLSQCNDLRLNLLPRLEYNFNLVQQLCDQQDDIFKSIVEQLDAN